MKMAQQKIQKAFERHPMTRGLGLGFDGEAEIYEDGEFTSFDVKVDSKTYRGRVFGRVRKNDAVVEDYFLSPK